MSNYKGVKVRLYERRGYAQGGLVEAAEAVRNGGRWGDEILIHVNPEEFAQMQQMWGEPTLNPHTGLPEYGFLSKLWKKIKKVVKAVAPIALNFIPGVGTALSAGLSAIGVGPKALPLATAIAKGAIGGGISGGGKGALIGAVTGGLGGGAGVASKLGLGQGALQTAFGDALTSGALTAAGGGKFGEGALMGGLSSLAFPALNNAMAKTELGQRLGMTQVPTLMSPNAGLEQLQEYEPLSARRVPTGPEINTLSDGMQEVVVNGSRSGGLPVVAPAGLSSPIAFKTDDVSVAANAIPTPDVGAVDPGPEPEQPNQSFLQKAFGYATKNPLQTATALMMLQGLGGDRPEVENPPMGSVPGQQPGFGDPLPEFKFSRQQVPSYQDYYTYGRRPETSFYVNNQQPTRMASGGLALLGDGGRSDMIDARLSEGEYVMDAETVALLGDGSTAAGAKKLDALRKNIRTHKGRALAKGKISPNAKVDAAAYMRGAK